MTQAPDTVNPSWETDQVVPSRMRLRLRAPFHLEATVRVLQRRPTNLIDTWDGQHYRRTVRIRQRPLLLELSNRGTIDAPELTLSVLPAPRVPADWHEPTRLISDVLGLKVDARPAEKQTRIQPQLRITARALRGMRPPRYPDLFETFANVIPFQQLSLEAGIAVTSQLIRRFGQVYKFDGRDQSLFPSAEAIADSRVAALKSCGLSTRKAVALRSIAHAIARGALKAYDIQALSSSDALDRLMKLPGIGPWSAALVLLRGFGRLDVFPPGDAGAEKSLTNLMGLRSVASLTRLVDRFGEYRGYLYFYGIASRLLAMGLISAAP
jgi:DNA-3-methyladenine glycosylase II